MSYESQDIHSPRLVSCESSKFGLCIASFLIVVVFIQRDQKAADNFEAIDLSLGEECY